MSKTKTIVISAEERLHNIKIEGKNIELVTHFQYLGSVFYIVASLAKK